MSKKRKNAVTAAILGAAIGVSAGPAHANKLLSVKPLGTAQSVRSSILQGDAGHSAGAETSNAYGASSSKGGEGKCGEGKCGDGKKESGSSSSDKGGEGKCGEGKCGGA